MLSPARVYLAGRARAGSNTHCGWLGKVAEKVRSALPPGLELLESASMYYIGNTGVLFPGRIHCRSILCMYCGMSNAHYTQIIGGAAQHCTAGGTSSELRSVTRALTRPQLSLSINLHGPGYMTSPRLTDERHCAWSFPSKARSIPSSACSH
jgi:hypothetical protein